MVRVRTVLLSLAVATAMLAFPALAFGDFGDRELKRGMRGDDVRDLQSILTGLGIRTEADGVFGLATERNVKRYERRRFRVNGVVTRYQAGMTALAYVRRGRSARSGSPLLGDRTLRRGSRGRDVKELQSLLTKLGFRTGADGAFGPATDRSVKNHERRRRRRADGVVTPSEAGLMLFAGSKRRPSSGGPRGTRRSHVFPIRGSHSYGSPFGEDRGSYRHRGQDISAASGTPLVAVTASRVAYRRYQASGAGNYLVLHGADGTDYVYMHMRETAAVREGTHVSAGQHVGRVGSTGRSSGPHLHFEMWTRHWYDGGNPFDPLPSLRRWDAYS